MILCQNDLRKEVEAGNIKFDPPLEERQWGEASVDLRLGFQFTKFRNAKGITLSIADGLASLGNLGLWDTKTLRERDEFGEREAYDLKGNYILDLA